MSRGIVPAAQGTMDILVRVCLEDLTVRTVRARLTDPINSLLESLPGDNRVFVYAGEVLVGDMTFSYYNIQNNEYIVSVRLNPGKKQRQLEFWIRTTSDSDNFQERMVWATNALTNREMGRIQDLRYLKSEARPRFKARNNKPALIGDWACSSSDYVSSQISFQSEPSTEALPVFWTSSEE